MSSVNSEILFRISLYIARFLYPSDHGARKATFIVVKKLDNFRSSAVHCSRKRGGFLKAVDK